MRVWACDEVQRDPEALEVLAEPWFQLMRAGCVLGPG